jgi:CRP/FNR family transcriptional regulator, cyclic AMP receptor protein
MSTFLAHSPLADCIWFGSLNSVDQQVILGAVQARGLRTNEALFLQGDGAGDFYYLKKGVLKISSVQENGKEAIFSMMEAGTWFGAIALLDKLPRSHSARAMSPCELLVVPQAAFNRLMHSAGFARAIAVMLAVGVRGLFGMIEDATMGSTRARIAARLLALAHGGTADANSSARISQDSLAMMLGITRQTLNKQLQAMAADGTIALGYGRIGIASVNALKAIADRP